MGLTHQVDSRRQAQPVFCLAYRAAMTAAAAALGAKAHAVQRKAFQYRRANTSTPPGASLVGVRRRA